MTISRIGLGTNRLSLNLRSVSGDKFLRDRDGNVLRDRNGNPLLKR